MRKFLATTALDEFWDTSQSIVFLDEWCMTYEKKDIWKNLNAELLPYQRRAQAWTQEAYDYSLKLFEIILQQMSNWLNKIHRVNFSSHYWRIVIGPFLLWYIQVIYTRYVYLQQAFDYYPNLDTIGLSKSSYLTPINTQEFSKLSAESHIWNLQLITQLLDLAFIKPSRYQAAQWTSELSQRSHLFTNEFSFKRLTKVKLAIVKLIAKLKTSKLIALSECDYYFKKNNLYSLIVSSGFKILPIVQLYKSQNYVLQEQSLDLETRSQLMGFSIPDNFSRLVLQTLIVNMPMNFIEFFKKEIKESELSFPYHPKVIVAGGWLLNDRLKMWGAKKAEQGTRLVNLQHGGGYGIVRYCSYEVLERNPDFFISWGWQEDAKTIPAPSILICESHDKYIKHSKQQKNKSTILWAVTEVDHYLAFIASYLNNMRDIYFAWQEQFIKKLNNNVLSQITMRVRPHSKYYNYWKSRLPELCIYLPTEKKSFFDQLNASKILISDNLNTTFLYGLSFNVPTIIFWDKNLFQIRDKVKPLFKLLQDVHIYHDTPESAAAFLNTIYEQPLLWWEKEDVQTARNNFCNEFALSSPQWLKEWKSILIKILHTSLKN